ACFSKSHTAPVVMMALGGFAEGVVEPSPVYVLGAVAGTYANGSDKNHLKLFGDVNGDGNIVYVEYVCDNGSIAVDLSPWHNVYRNVLAYNVATPKAAVTKSQILLPNVSPNSHDNGSERSCFKYQWTTINGLQYVTDVAITLTVQTEQSDTLTRKKQTETKA